MPTQLRLIDETAEPRPAVVPDIDLNLFLIWDYTNKLELEYVHIVCPHDTTSTEVFVEWIDILDNPLEAGRLITEPTTTIHEDLTFRLRDDTTDKEEELDEGAE